jgi:hypothetical protein
MATDKVSFSRGEPPGGSASPIISRSAVPITMSVEPHNGPALIGDAMYLHQDGGSGSDALALVLRRQPALVIPTISTSEKAIVSPPLEVEPRVRFFRSTTDALSRLAFFSSRLDAVDVTDGWWMEVGPIDGALRDKMFLDLEWF